MLLITELTLRGRYGWKIEGKNGVRKLPQDEKKEVIAPTDFDFNAIPVQNGNLGSAGQVTNYSFVKVVLDRTEHSIIFADVTLVHQFSLD